MSIPLLHSCASIVLSMVMIGSATAATSPANSHTCTTVADPAKRLACYDSAFPPAGGARSGAIDVEAERAKALREFGLNREQLRVREPEWMRDVSPERIQAKVAGVTSRPTGERLVALDSGQVWLLTEVTTKGQLRVGDPIDIRTAALGTYMLVTPGRVALRARRIK